jgi:hypothetical protein
MLAEHVSVGEPPTRARCMGPSIGLTSLTLNCSILAHLPFWMQTLLELLSQSTNLSMTWHTMGMDAQNTPVYAL